jgi:hypothetical protein
MPQNTVAHSASLPLVQKLQTSKNRPPRTLSKHFFLFSLPKNKPSNHHPSKTTPFLHDHDKTRRLLHLPRPMRHVLTHVARGASSRTRYQGCERASHREEHPPEPSRVGLSVPSPHVQPMRENTHGSRRLQERDPPAVVRERIRVHRPCSRRKNEGYSTAHPMPLLHVRSLDYILPSPDGTRTTPQVRTYRVSFQHSMEAAQGQEDHRTSQSPDERRILRQIPTPPRPRSPQELPEAQRNHRSR